MTTAAAPIGTTDWSLTRIRRSAGGEECDHCGRRLKNLCSVANRVTGQGMTVGRGCCKTVTGWTLEAAGAAARKAAVWQAFTQAHPDGAHLIETDMARWSRTHSVIGPAHDAHDLIRSATVPPGRWESYLRNYIRRHAPGHDSSTPARTETTEAPVSDLVHLPSGAGDGSDNGFLSLARRVTTLAAAALMLKEGMFVLKARMERNSGAARRLSEMCGVAEVEPKYTAQILEVSGALHQVAQASGDVATTADDMQIKAQGFNSAHQSEYRGIYEAVNASGVRQAKPGFYRVR